MKLKMMKRGLCALLVLFLAVALLPVLNTYAAKENFAISAVSVTGIDVPLAGAKPDFTAEVSSSARYVLADNAVEWVEYDEGWEWTADLTANSTFKKGYWYVVYATVNAKDGYSFNSSVSGSIDGNSAMNSGKPTSEKASFYFAFQCTDTAITKVELTVVSPAVGKTPTFAKVDTTQYESKNNDPKLSNQTNGVVWTNMSSGVNLTVSNPFKENVNYSVSYTLYPKSGYQFAKNLTATINGKTALVKQENGYIVVRLENLKASYKTITPVTITCVTAPAVGKTPTYTLNAAGNYFTVQGQNDDYWSNGVAWVEFKPGATSGTVMKKTATFKPGYTYKLYIDLVPTDAAYAFVKNESVVTVNGKNATVVVDGRNARAIYSFDTLPELTVPGVSVNCTAPVAGKTPNYTITTSGSYYSVVDQDSDYWVNGVAWVEFVPGASSGTMMKKTDKFKAGNKYAICMDVTVSTDGYAFVKDQTTATVNGKTATLNIDGKTARLIYTFPALSQMTVSKVEINVTAPAAGAKPSFDKIDGNGYYSDNNGNPVAVFKNGIAWFKSPSAYIAAGTNGTFEAGKDYTLKISLVAKDGYVLAKNLTATVNGKTAAVTHLDNGGAMLEVVLSTPKTPHTHTPSGWQTDDEYHWKVCTDAQCGSIVVQKQMHLNSDSDGKCDTCGYQLPIELPDDPTKPTEPNTPDDPTVPTDPLDPTVPSEPEVPTEATKPADDAKEPADNSGFIWIAVAALILAIGAVVVVVILKNKSQSK